MCPWPQVSKPVKAFVSRPIRIHPHVYKFDFDENLNCVLLTVVLVQLLALRCGQHVFRVPQNKVCQNK